MNLERVLDGPNVGYCSDSDDEQDLAASGPPGASQTQKSPYDGPQTGPKGVLADYDNYNRDLDLKEIESELKVRQLANKFTLKNPQNALAGNDDDNELDALRRKRLEQIRKIAQGKIVELADKDNFLSVIEGNPAFRVFIHIYKDGDETSQTLNSALLELGSSTGLTSKMFKVKSTLLETSEHFTNNALPVLQIYENGTLIGNFLRIADRLGHDFSAKDLTQFLECNDIPLNIK